MEGSGLENAGIVDIGDGWGITMKIESHNHPSAVEPYQGAATGVGGILRDIFTMGARPIACLNSLRFGPITEGSAPDEVVKRNRYLFRRVVEGIGGYGNCVGVPTVAGEIEFHPRYSGNPLVNAMAVGILRLDEVTTAAAAGNGNPVIYMGSSTGKDGIHGASFASESLDADNESKRPNVQIGDPFAEKILIEATLEALKTGAIVAIQDMGAAGLTCSTIEMSAKGDVGMNINLDLVPSREEGMTGYELMLSESQERMLCVAHKGREQEVIDVFHKWGAHAVVIGDVTDDKRVKVWRTGELIADLNPHHLADECPTYQLNPLAPEYFTEAKNFDIDSILEADPYSALLTLLSTPNIASKRWVFEQYDYSVQTQTAIGPGHGDAAVLALRGTQKGIALKVDGNARWTYLDPYVGGQLAVAEAARNVACTGALPLAATDGLNFGNPEQPHVFWQFDRAVKGIADACEALQTPVISGNVSFYNESQLGEVLPTPLIGVLGLLNDKTKHTGMAIPPSEGELFLLQTSLKDISHKGLGASEYLASVHGIENGTPIAPNLVGEKSLHHALVELTDLQIISAAHDVSSGGIGVALAEMTIPHQVGINVNLNLGEFDRRDACLFGEFPGRVVVSTTAELAPQLLNIAKAQGLECIRLGTIEPDTKSMIIDSIIWNLADLRLAFESGLAQNMEYYTK